MEMNNVAAKQNHAELQGGRVKFTQVNKAFIGQDQDDLFFIAYLLPPLSPSRYTNVHFSNVQSTKL